MVEQKQKVKETRSKIDNYAKYVKEMYYPKVSVKKQLEMEHVISTLKHQSIRRSQDMDSEEDNGLPKGDYERPWRDALSSREL
jgi:hypothetical protein